MKKLLFLSITLLTLNTHADITIQNNTSGYIAADSTSDPACATALIKNNKKTILPTMYGSFTGIHKCFYKNIKISKYSSNFNKRNPWHNPPVVTSTITIPVQDNTTYLVTESNGKISAIPSN